MVIRRRPVYSLDGQLPVTSLDNQSPAAPPHHPSSARYPAPTRSPEAPKPTFNPEEHVALTVDLLPSEVAPAPDIRRTPARSNRPELPPLHYLGRYGPNRPPLEARRINGLAGICLMALVATRLGLPLPGGHLAIDAILTIVGFQLVIGAKRLANSRRRWFGRFLITAIGPIVAPALVAIGLATLGWWRLVGLGETEVFGAIGAAAMVSNVTLSLGIGQLPPTDHLWLVASIVQFALIAPLLVVAARKRLSEVRLLIIVGLLVGAVVGARLALITTGSLETEILAIHPAIRLDGLLIGVMVAIPNWPIRRNLPRGLGSIALAMLLVIFAQAPSALDNPLISLGLLGPIVALATAAIVASAMADDHREALGRLVGHLVPRWFGERAISIYVWHQLFATTVGEEGQAGLLNTEWPGASLFVIRMVFALAAGAASYRYLQLPIRNAVERLVGSDRQVVTRRPIPPDRQAALRTG